MTPETEKPDYWRSVVEIAEDNSIESSGPMIEVAEIYASQYQKEIDSLKQENNELKNMVVLLNTEIERLKADRDQFAIGFVVWGFHLEPEDYNELFPRDSEPSFKEILEVYKKTLENETTKKA